MIVGEGQKSVLVVPSTEASVENESVCLHDIERVERRALRRDVLYIDAVRPVRAQSVEPFELGIEHDICRRRAGTLNLQIGLGKNRH